MVKLHYQLASLIFRFNPRFNINSRFSYAGAAISKAEQRKNSFSQILMMNFIRSSVPQYAVLVPPGLVHSSQTTPSAPGTWHAMPQPIKTKTNSFYRPILNCKAKNETNFDVLI